MSVIVGVATPASIRRNGNKWAEVVKKRHPRESNQVRFKTKKYTEDSPVLTDRGKYHPWKSGIRLPGVQISHFGSKRGKEKI
jgi:hypothetical protein